DRGNRYPLLAFVARTFDLYTIPPVAWEPYFDEVVAFLGERFDIEVDEELATVIAVQGFLLPRRNRTFPDELAMDHDWVEFVENHRAASRGRAIRRRLRSFGPGALEVTDPSDICG